MISTLRDGFVNTWLLARDLESIAAQSGDPDITKLCALIRSNYGYPVDSVLIAPDLSVVGHLNVDEPAAMHPEGYVSFLRRGLAAARGEEHVEVAHAEAKPAARRVGPRERILTPAAPTDSILHVIRRAGLGEPGMTYFSIDATAFAQGGRLEITVRLGEAAALGKFELCAATGDDARMMSPVETLDELQPTTSGTLTLDFDAGARFGLAAMAAAGSDEGAINSFLATVTVHAR